LLFLAAAADLSGLGFWNFWCGQLFLGVGWNFLYVGGSTLLTEGYQPAERSKVQGVNDFLIFGTVAGIFILVRLPAQRVRLDRRQLRRIAAGGADPGGDFVADGPAPAGGPCRIRVGRGRPRLLPQCCEWVA
jgi:MFS family permease